MNLTLEQEKILIKESLGGNNESYKKLIENQRGKIDSLRTLVSNFTNEEYEDCLQNARNNAFLNLKNFHQKSSFTTWFYVILKNKIIQFSKKKSILNTKEISINEICKNQNEDNIENLFGKLEDNAQTIISKREELEEYKQILQKCLDKLEPKYSEVLNLAFVENRTRKEIADTLKIPLGSVLSRIFVARQKAKKVILSYIRINDLTLDCLDKKYV